MSGTLVSLAAALGLLLPQPLLLRRPPQPTPAPAPRPAIAPEAEAEPEPAPAPDPDLTRAEELYERGRAKFETVDYLGAIALWTEAYGIVPDSPASAPIKAALIYNIATAQDRAYNIDHDLAHLRTAAELMARYIGEVGFLYTEAAAADEERAKAQTELDQLQARIAEAEASGAPVEVEPTPPVTLIDPPREDPTARPMIISGAVLVAAGVGGIGLMAGGMSLGKTSDSLDALDPNDLQGRQERFDKGKLGNTLAYVGGIGGGLLLAGGAVLLGLGIKRKRSSTVAAVPVFGRRMAGAALRGRF